MVLTEITNVIELNANTVSFLASIFVCMLFYYQYKKYEAVIKEEEMIDQFLTTEEN